MSPRAWLASIAILLGCTSAAAASEATVRIADGDWQALYAALEGSAGANTRILLAPGGHYAPLQSPPPIAGAVLIEGGGASWDLSAVVEAESPQPSAQLWHVLPGARLTVRSLHARGWPGAAAPRAPVIRNEGEIAIEGSTLSGLRSHSDLGMVVNAAGAQLRLSNVTLSDNANPCLGFGCIAGGRLFHNAGSVRFEQTTVASSLTLHVLGLHGRYEVLDSIVERSGMNATCEAAVVSLGGNVFGDASCGTTAADRTAASAGLAPLADNGGPVPSRALLPDSVARGLGAHCLALDARGAMRPAQACDAGATESAGRFGNPNLDSGHGVDGVYYAPADDGRYLHVQSIREGMALLTWMTFDADGRAAWIYAPADHDAGAVRGTAYINLVADDGSIRAHAWGTLGVDWLGCDRVRLSFASDHAGFGTGSAELERLTGLHGIGCAR